MASSAGRRHTPRVSVCVPFFDAADFLAETIESVRRQTFTDWEIVAVDNASTDEGLSVLRSFDDPRIRIYRNSVNVGHVANFNQAFGLARSPLVKILCADDLLHPEYLQRSVDVFDAHPGVGMVFTRRSLQAFGPGGSERLSERKLIYESKHRRFGELATANPGRELFDRYLVGRFDDNWVGEPSNVMLRRALIERIGSFNRRVRRANDMDLWIRSMFFSDVGFLDAELTIFRQHDDSLTGTQQRSQTWWLDRLWIVEGLWSYAEVRRSVPKLRRLLQLERLRALARLPEVILTDAERAARVRDCRDYARFKRAQLRGSPPPLYGPPVDHPPIVVRDGGEPAGG